LIIALVAAELTSWKFGTQSGRLKFHSQFRQTVSLFVTALWQPGKEKPRCRTAAGFID
jgi:hypothetical protein